jgi:hypothetical protein
MQTKEKADSAMFINYRTEDMREPIRVSASESASVSEPFMEQTLSLYHQTLFRAFNWFPSPYWDVVSLPARRFVRSLLTLDPENRPSAEVCLPCQVKHAICPAICVLLPSIILTAACCIQPDESHLGK